MATPTTDILQISDDVIISAQVMIFRTSSSTLRVRSRSVSGTEKVISVFPGSLAAVCTIISTLICASASAPNTVAAIPGESSIATSVTLASSRLKAIPLTELFSISGSSSITIVPGKSSKLDNTCNLTLWRIAMATDRVCRTLAPPDAISSISSNVI